MSFSPHIGGKPQTRGVRAAREAEIVQIASVQHGVVTRTQLGNLGLTARGIDSRILSGRLHPIHRAVYLLGHRAVTWRSLELAAVLACGRRAVLSHRSAARFWKLLSYPAEPDFFDVTVGTKSRARRPGIRLHTSRGLTRSDVVRRDGIWVTKPARTLVDLAGHVPRHELERAVNEAHVLRLVSHQELAGLVAEHPGRHGIRALRDVVDGDLRMTRLRAERRLLLLLSRSHLPPPETNALVAGYEVDFLWHAEKLIVETDGWVAHSSRIAFERDRRRDAELAARGFQVLRVTWRQLADEPAATVAVVRRALGARPRRRADSGWR